jgi:hypothetical protein
MRSLIGAGDGLSMKVELHTLNELVSEKSSQLPLNIICNAHSLFLGHVKKCNKIAQ